MRSGPGDRVVTTSVAVVLDHTTATALYGTKNAGPLAGLPGRHQRVAHGGGGTGGCEEPADRGGGSGTDRPQPVLVPGLLRTLPQPALAGVVITASLSLADVLGTVRLWRQRRTEFLLLGAAFLGVALLGVLPGIALAVGLSVLNVPRRAWRPYRTVLGPVDGLEGYHDIRSHHEAAQLPGLVIHRAEPVADVDTTAADILEELDTTLNASHLHLVFAELKDPVRRASERYGLTRTIDPDHFFPTVEAAVAAFRLRTGAQWRPPTPPDPDER